jgi:hypothetical protein
MIPTPRVGDLAEPTPGRLKSIEPYIYRCMSSRTSIQLDDETKTLLDRVKKAKGAASYAEAIRLLVKDAKRLEHSELGSLPRLKEFQRDKHDRLAR